MNIQNNFNDTYKQYIENQKIQQQQMEATAKNVSNDKVRAYLEASNKVMGQLNQIDEFVFSKACQQEKPQGFFGKAKAFLQNIFKK